MLKPMMPREVKENVLKEIEHDRQFIVSKKYDGFRVLYVIKNSGNKMYTRFGGNKVEQVPLFKVKLNELNDTIIDGELIAKSETWYDTASIVGSEPKQSIEKQKEKGLVKFIIFDIPKYCGKDIKSLSLKERREYLIEAYNILKKHKLPVFIEKWINSDKINYYNNIIDIGGEGVLIKDIQSIYVPGRVKNGWMKVKKSQTSDFIITGINTGKGRYANTTGNIGYGAYTNGDIKQIGTSSGIIDDVRADMRDHPRKYIGRVAEFESTGITPVGKMRHPRFKRMRPDKSPKSVRVKVNG